MRQRAQLVFASVLHHNVLRLGERLHQSDRVVPQVEPLVYSRGRCARGNDRSLLGQRLLARVLVELAFVGLQREQGGQEGPLVGRHRDLQNLVQAQKGELCQVGFPLVNVLLLPLQNDLGVDWRLVDNRR